MSSLATGAGTKRTSPVFTLFTTTISTTTSKALVDVTTRKAKCLTTAKLLATTKTIEDVAQRKTCHDDEDARDDVFGHEPFFTASRPRQNVGHNREGSHNYLA
jgi:hypothetical protein